MEATLREISDAVWSVIFRRKSEEERKRVYDRARMLRDKKLILSSNSRYQGKEMEFSEADVAAATIALVASLNGMSWGIIDALNSQLRSIGNTRGRPEFETHLEKIKAGEEVYVRLDIISEPWGSTKAVMGGPEVKSDDRSLPSDIVVTQSTNWDVTRLAKPVLEKIAQKRNDETEI